MTVRPGASPEAQGTAALGAATQEPSAAFTPGPWELEVGDHTHSYVKVTGSDERTVHYMYIASRDYPEIIEANARLIAAAPELYEAARAAKALLVRELEEPERTVFWKLVGALAKAEGKP